MDIRNLLILLWRKLWLVGLVAVLAGTAVYLGMSQTGAIPQYTAKTVVAIGGDIYGETPDADYIELANTMMADLIQLAQLEIVTGAVVRNLGLSESLDTLAERIDVAPIQGTNLVSIQVTYSDPETAVAIAKEIVNQLQQISPPRWRNFILVVEAAQLPTRPDATAVLPVILTALTAAIFVVGLIFIIEYLRQPFYDERDIAELLGLPTLFTLKPVPLLWWRCLRNSLLSDKERVTWWSLKEACQQRLNKMGKAAGPQTVLLLSPDNSVSQAYVAVHLALAWANESQKTTLADIDLLQAHATQLLLHEPPDDGFFSLINQPEADPTKYLQVVSHHQWLRLLGSKAGQPPLSTSQLRQTIDTLWKLVTQNTVTVISAATAVSGIETILAAARADLVLLVVDARFTPYQQTAEAVSLLAANDISVDGIVLADLGTRRAAFSAAWYLAPQLRRLFKRIRDRRKARQSSYQIGQQT